MDIDNLIAREASDDTDHDKNYARALRQSYDQYHHLTGNELLGALDQARARYRGFPTHKMVADCMVLYELVKEEEDGK